MRNFNRVTLAALPLSMALAGCASWSGDQQHQALQQIEADGFSDESLLYVNSDNKHEALGTLVMGLCTFDTVRAVVTYSNGKVSDIGPYHAEALGTGEGKYHIAGLTLKFDNAAQLQQELPDVHCSPENQ